VDYISRRNIYQLLITVIFRNINAFNVQNMPLLAGEET